ncbi:MAG: hypothetical protein GY752_10040 [bacterium]|nr:hypothetical protein [bacterium]
MKFSLELGKIECHIEFMNNFKVILRANDNVQDWYVRCDSEQTAERLVLDMSEALANPKVSVIDGNNDKVSGLELHPNRPVLYILK